MLYCPGTDCPLREDCCHHTQPAPPRAAFGALPYDAATGACAYFSSNVPGEAAVREAAYYLFLRAGRPGGQGDEHWDEAYRNLCAGTGRKVT